MIEVAGEHLQYIAFHHGFGPQGGDSVLRDNEYRKDSQDVGTVDGALSRTRGEDPDDA